MVDRGVAGDGFESSLDVEFRAGGSRAVFGFR
jgi:hypothetical protein